MSNNYYVHASNLVAGTKAKAEDINSRCNSIEDGFDKLPAPHASAPSTKGFSEVFTVLDATAQNHPASAKQVRDGAITYAEDTGTANTVVANLPFAPSGYTAGMEVKIKLNATNSGAATVNLNSLGAKNIKRLTGEDLIGGDLVEDRVAGLRYDGTNFILIDGTYAIHSHNDLYYTESEADGLFEPKLANPSTSGMVLSSTTDGTKSWVHSLPVGTTIIWRTATPPDGTLENNGAAISRTAYAALFAKWGTMYGAGDGSTTFNLPDDRGEFLRGWAHGSTNDPDKATRTNRGDGTTGDNIGTKQADQLKSHDHGYSANTSDVYGSASVARHIYDDNATKQTDATGGNQTNPRNINVMFCTKY